MDISVEKEIHIIMIVPQCYAVFIAGIGNAKTCSFELKKRNRFFFGIMNVVYGIVAISFWKNKRIVCCRSGSAYN